MDLSHTPSHPACVAAKATMVAALTASGKGSKAYQDARDAYVAALKKCTEEAGINAPW